MLTSTLFRRALVALLLAVPLVVTGGTAQAAACSGSSGVTVIVQFPHGTVTGCAPGDPSSGAAALKSAGFSYTNAQGQAFVCTINNTPRTTCGRTPPANAYWAYFHARRGGSWSYSSLGAASSNPAPGSVEGWRFGSGAKPSTSPPAAASASKPKPKPKPTPKPAASARPSPASTPTTVASARPSAKASAAAKPAKVAAAAKPAKVAAAAKPAKPTTSVKKAKQRATKTKTQTKKKKAVAGPTASVSATPSGEPSAAVVSAPAQTSTQPAGGSSSSWLWGVAALVVVGGAAGAVTVVRRR